ncbi:MAG TPA: response regulator [Phycisphaerae bacterium]|nr:response regulator [Phycisphaerales bacterium]HRX84868.1 response regulator [Phycisphaerae bacterium]
MMVANVAERTEVSRILVVEDEGLIAEEIHERLKRLNFQVVGIEDTGPRAIDAVIACKPDLVLMDIRLKGSMDGIETAEAIIREQLDVPVIFLTAHSDEATLQRAKRAAPFGYILKPFHERELMVAIEMAMHRHVLERRLRESELRYATTLASIGDGVLATDRDGRVTYLNPVAEALTAWDADDARDVAADEILVLLDEKTQSQLPSPIAAALRGGQARQLSAPVLLLPREGDAVLIDDSAAPIRNQKGEITGAVVAFRDIRQRRQAEEALRRTEEQLREAQKLESIGQLAGGVAHDFNNFLTVIHGCGEHLLKRGGLSAADAELVQEILKAADRSANLTKQLLAFGRRQRLDPQVLDLNTLVDSTGQLLSRLLGEHVRIAVSKHPSPAAVRADPGQLEQVIINLAVNARDAMPGGGTLSFATAVEELAPPSDGGDLAMEPGRYVVLKASDTGVGMDAKTLARVFEPFFTTKGVGRGTGLGLATVYGIINQSGGHILAESAVGRGTTFTIYLPAVAYEAPASEPVKARDTTERASAVVLLVEDDAAVRAIAASGLRAHGYEVVEADSGAEAIKRFEEDPGAIDILVSDTVMPGLSGPQVAEKLLEARPELSVLLLSGYSSDIIANPQIMKRAAFMQKPFTPTGLANRVHEVLTKRPR